MDSNPAFLKMYAMSNKFAQMILNHQITDVSVSHATGALSVLEDIVLQANAKNRIALSIKMQHMVNVQVPYVK
jgi:hypothetical protein